MKLPMVLYLLFLVAANAIGSAPLEINITRLALPEVAVEVKNTDHTRTMLLWERGMSGGDRCVSFQFGNASGEIMGESQFIWGSYNMNYPATFELKPGKTKEWVFDLSDKDLWSHPEGIDYRHAEGISVRALFRQKLEHFAHEKKVFTGLAFSPWRGGSARSGAASCTEWSCLPLISSPAPTVFFSAYSDRLNRALDVPEALRQNKSLADLLGSYLPWEHVGAWSNGINWLTLFMPGQKAVALYWPIENFSALEKKELSQGLGHAKLSDAALAKAGVPSAAQVLASIPASRCERAH